MKLFNKVNNDELKLQMLESTEKRTTLSFYRYARIEYPALFRNEFYRLLDEVGVFGRIYVSAEGVNGQISVPTTNFEEFKKRLYSIPFLNGCRLNIAIDDDGKSFFKLKIKVRDKIVADGLDDQSFDVTKRGRHLNAREYNAITEDPATIVVDMRNHYESEVGYFENAIRPDVVTFREALPLVEDMLADKKDRNIVMYCTGGIRCEKASAYYLHRGFKNVFMVDGGIIEYARQCEEQGLPNKFIGKNFVFDERLGERISQDVVARCHQCGQPCDTHVNCANNACHLLFIQCDECAEKLHNCCSLPCAEFIQLPEDQQVVLRKTAIFNGTRFSKGRYKAFRQGEDLVMG
ncbi:MAG: rhodanese-related sulfurtransferase [Lewinellaceae bacterium]|nr:rhodanese-related sulfurtransferase [Saprospiraceae bacterium]MCB9337356.1 rhodanese-related sulfurtransferase [Lewinellaceae bacterium]